MTGPLRSPRSPRAVVLALGCLALAVAVAGACSTEDEGQTPVCPDEKTCFTQPAAAGATGSSGGSGQSGEGGEGGEGGAAGEAGAAGDGGSGG